MSKADMMVDYGDDQYDRNDKTSRLATHTYSTGCPKKIGILSSFEFLDLGGVFTEVKNKNFGNKKDIGLYSKILSKWAFFIRKMQKILQFYEFMAMLRMKNIFRC